MQALLMRTHTERQAATMSLLSLRPLHGLAPLGLLVLRVVVGFVMFAHGWQKWTGGPDGWLAAGWLASLGVPAPVFFAWVVLVVETAGALMLVAGLATRVWAGLIAIDTLAATILVKLPMEGTLFGILAPPNVGPGAELDLTLMAAAIALLLVGPGPISLDRTLGIERDRAF